MVFLRFEGRTHERSLGVDCRADSYGLAGSHSTDTGSPASTDFDLADLHSRTELVNLWDGGIAKLRAEKCLLIELHRTNDEGFAMRVVGKQNVLQRGNTIARMNTWRLTWRRRLLSATKA